MMNRLTIVLFLILFVQLAFAQKKKVCVTIDDLPFVSYSIHDISFQKEMTQKLIDTLSKYGVPAIGFVNESKLYTNNKVDQKKVDLLKIWLDNGMELGNHTFAHKNFHDISFGEFSEDILKGEIVCKDLTAKYRQEYKYFRHPYLRVGLTKSAHDSLKVFLSEHGYTEAPVTIDNSDYLFALAYHKAYVKNDIALMSKIGNAFIEYIEQKMAYFEKQSEVLFGRNISHTLLLHANKLNADMMGELIKMYQGRGYEFVSLAEALKDEAYQSEITKYGNWGISWIDRWALSRGYKGDFFKNDPETPAFIVEMTK